MGVLVGVRVGGMGVNVGVAVGGIGVNVGVAVGGMGVNVGVDVGGMGVKVGGTGVNVGTGVGVDGIGVNVGVGVTSAQGPKQSETSPSSIVHPLPSFEARIPSPAPLNVFNHKNQQDPAPVAPWMDTHPDGLLTQDVNSA